MTHKHTKVWNFSGFLQLHNHQMILFVLHRQTRGADMPISTRSVASTLLRELKDNYILEVSGRESHALEVELRCRGQPVVVSAAAGSAGVQPYAGPRSKDSTAGPQSIAGPQSAAPGAEMKAGLQSYAGLQSDVLHLTGVEFPSAPEPIDDTLFAPSAPDATPGGFTDRAGRNMNSCSLALPDTCYCQSQRLSVSASSVAQVLTRL